ncbi:MAG TPA: OpgC domain-containing protein [Azospirillaceae bacterium]|nr:OpgC domain-containing protein [Azospirillaceae bacterium]
MAGSGHIRVERDTAADFWRGVALVTIFVNHLAGNIFENLTHRNFGFSDAAELFVLLAGYAAAFAYFSRVRQGCWQDAVDKAIRRAALLYAAHAATFLAGAAIFAHAVLRTGDGRLFELVALTPLIVDPAASLVGAATLRYQPGFLNILPLYTVLLAAMPLLLLGAARSLAGTVAASCGLYAAANLAGWNLPNHPLSGGWFFNPFAWQFLFVIGFTIGALRLQGVGIGCSRVLFWTAVAYLVGALVWVRSGIAPDPDALPLPRFLWDLDKQNLSLPRLLHVLALAYVVVNLPLHRWVKSLGSGNPVVLMGRQSLPVFCLGLILSLWGLTLKVTKEYGVLFDVLFLAVGIAAQMCLAWLLARQGAPSPAPGTLAPGTQVAGTRTVRDRGSVRRA